MQKNKVYPVAEKTELAVVSLLIKHKNNIELAFTCDLTLEHFSIPIARQTFTVLEKMYKEKNYTNVDTVYDNAKKMGFNFDFNDLKSITNNYNQHSDELLNLIKELDEFKKQRKLMDLAPKIDEITNHNVPSNEKISKITDLVDKIAKAKEDENTYTQEKAFKSFEDFIDETQKNRGIKTVKFGLDELDDMEYGLSLSPGQHIIGARPGVGKTSLASGIINYNSFRGLKCLFFSAEMNINEIIMREVQRELGIYSNKIRSGMLTDKEIRDIKEYGRTLKDNVRYNDSSGISVEKLKSIAKVENSKDKIDYIVIDYLQLLKTNLKKANKYEEVGYISNEILSLSKDLKIPIITLAQLNRNTEKDDREPNLASLRDSGNIEQDASSVLFIHRPDMYADKPTKMNEERCKLIVAKNRFGSMGKFDAKFIKNRGKFVNFTDFDNTFTMDEDEENPLLTEEKKEDKPKKFFKIKN